jgi:uncharacterized membrane protein (DUF373 family)
MAMNEKQPTLTKTFRAQWAVMTFYERFEQVIALALSAIIAVIIVVSLLQLISIVFSLLIIDAFNPLDHKVFQAVFGMIMTLLIAMEFKHSIVRVALRRDSIIQVKTVILIGLIALARKFVILDPESIFLTRNQQDLRDAAGIQPVHTDKQKNAPPQTRHVLQQVECKSELARPIN